VVPLGDFGVCKQRVVATSEASLHALGDIVVERKISAEGVVRVLPVTILRFVDRLVMVSYGPSMVTFQKRSTEHIAAAHPPGKGTLTNHSSTK
jgi:hypothetical protein